MKFMLTYTFCIQLKKSRKHLPSHKNTENTYLLTKIHLASVLTKIVCYVLTRTVVC